MYIREVFNNILQPVKVFDDINKLCTIEDQIK
jgi:hypothetical protein